MKFTDTFINSFNDGFTFVPKSIKIPKAKAISVAIGTPNPVG